MQSHSYIFIFKKLKFSLYMPCRHIGGVEVQLYSFLTSAIDGGKRHALHPGERAVVPTEKVAG
jgi:hypothetical protein